MSQFTPRSAAKRRADDTPRNQPPEPHRRFGHASCHAGGVPGLSSICVFCGSNGGADPAYVAAAESVGAGLAQRGIRTVYGGGRVGLMGALANAARAGGGEVVGVMPQQLVDREIAHTGIDDLRVVDTMHERKALMVELADAFVALPGGIGTLEELFEVYTWAQLGIHAKPLGLMDVAGYYQRLVAFLDHSVQERFLRVETRALLAVSDDLDDLLTALETSELLTQHKWIDLDQT
jgi:uncharacterized protein (TIGR00730 family)